MATKFTIVYMRGDSFKVEILAENENEAKAILAKQIKKTKRAGREIAGAENLGSGAGYRITDLNWEY
jgi:hypothetical protein